MSSVREGVFALVIGALIVAMGPTTAHAQSGSLDIDSAGFVFERINVNVGELNSVLRDQFYPELSANLLLHGVTASGNFFNLFRYTAFAAGNAVSVGNSQGQISKYSLSYGGWMPYISLQQAPEYHIEAGLLLGGGRATLMLLEGPSGDFADAIAHTKQTHLRRSFLTLKPELRARVPITPWLHAVVAGGYMFVLSPAWEQHGAALPGPPQSLSSLTVAFTLEARWSRASE